MAVTCGGRRGGTSSSNPLLGLRPGEFPSAATAPSADAAGAAALQQRSSSTINQSGGSSSNNCRGRQRSSSAAVPAAIVQGTAAAAPAAAAAAAAARAHPYGRAWGAPQATAADLEVFLEDLLGLIASRGFLALAWEVRPHHQGTIGVGARLGLRPGELCPAHLLNRLSLRAFAPIIWPSRC